MPTLWKVTLVVLTACLHASIVIGTVRLVTTPTEIIGDDFQAWHAGRFPR